MTLTQRMQTSAKGTYNGMLHCAGGILKNEGPLAFYKVNHLSPYALFYLILFQGTLTPLLGIGVCVSIQFGVLEYAKRVFTTQNLARGVGGVDGKMLGGGQLVIAGVAAGLANGVVSGPVEHIRIREFPLNDQHLARNPFFRSANAVKYEPAVQGSIRCNEENCFAARHRRAIQRTGCHLPT